MRHGKNEKLLVGGFDGWFGNPDGHACFCKGDFIERRLNRPVDLRHHCSSYHPSPVDPGNNSLLFLHRHQFGDAFKEEEGQRGSRREGRSSRVQTSNR